MDCQNQNLKLNYLIKLNYSLKFWIQGFIKVVLKNGKIIKIKNLLYNLLYRLINFCGNLKFFFKIFKKRLFLPIFFRSRIVAGKKILIPIRLSKGKEFSFMWRLLIESSNKRSEFSFEDRVFFELIDVFKNKGLTLKRRLQFCKDIKTNSPNLRFLKFN